jgi:hypothetical protein
MYHPYKIQIAEHFKDQDKMVHVKASRVYPWVFYLFIYLFLFYFSFLFVFYFSSKAYV